MNMVASVINISGIRIFTIIMEFNIPTINAAAIAEIMATKVFCENQTNMEITIAFDKEATDPTERSKPSTVKLMVIPIAMMVTIEMERSIFTILFPWIKAGLANENMIMSAMIVIIVPYL